MAKTKSKAKVFCQCAKPRPLVDGNGQPFTAEPICRKPTGCGYPIKLIPPGLRTPPGPQIQSRSPVASWAGEGQCPRPPELESTAAFRGDLAARVERLKTVTDLDATVNDDLDRDAPAGQRALTRWLLDRLLSLEDVDPSPRYARPQTAAAAPPPLPGAAPLKEISP